MEHYYVYVCWGKPRYPPVMISSSSSSHHRHFLRGRFLAQSTGFCAHWPHSHAVVAHAFIIACTVANRGPCGKVALHFSPSQHSLFPQIKSKSQNWNHVWRTKPRMEERCLQMCRRSPLCGCVTVTHKECF